MLLKEVLRFLPLLSVLYRGLLLEEVLRFLPLLSVLYRGLYTARDLD
jgi:hypothetical protein